MTHLGVARRSLLLALLVVPMLGLAAPAARADLVTVTSGDAVLEVNFATVQAMAAEHIYTSVLPPATLKLSLPVPEATFPLSGGTVESTTMLGVVNLAGGLRLQKCGTNCDDIIATQDTTNLRIVNGLMVTGDTMSIPTPQFDLANTSVSQDPSGTVYFEADVNMNAATAVALNVLFSTSVFTPGLNLGHFRVTINPVPYEVPRRADFNQFSLVPVFRQCGTGANPANGAHAAPLSTGSCNPPVPTANDAAVGPQTSGAVLTQVDPGDPNSTINEADVEYSVFASDIRQGSPTGADYDPNPSGPDMTAVIKQRITDHGNEPSGRAPGTATDLDFSFPIDCVGNGDPSVGSFCSADTTANAEIPGSVNELRQTEVSLFRARLNDAGANGIPGDGDDHLFMQQGIYVP